MDEHHKNQQYSVNLYFGKKDADLCRWVRSVPRGLFSYYVKEAIKSYLKGDENYRLPTFPVKENKNTSTTITKPLSLTCYTLEDKQVYNFIMSFDDHMRSYEIKKILRKYLNPSANSPDENLNKNTSVQVLNNSNKRENSSEIPPLNNKKNDMIPKFVAASRNRSRAKK